MYTCLSTPTRLRCSQQIEAAYLGWWWEPGASSSCNLSCQAHLLQPALAQQSRQHGLQQNQSGTRMHRSRTIFPLHTLQDCLINPFEVSRKVAKGDMPTRMLSSASQGSCKANPVPRRTSNPKPFSFLLHYKPKKRTPPSRSELVVNCMISKPFEFGEDARKTCACMIQ